MADIIGFDHIYITVSDMARSAAAARSNARLGPRKLRVDLLAIPIRRFSPRADNVGGGMPVNFVLLRGTRAEGAIRQQWTFMPKLTPRQQFVPFRVFEFSVVRRS